MARIVKEEEYTEKRNAILAAARRLVYTKGYEQMTIQDLLDDRQISKGAFYHYFDSKQAVLEALIDQMLDEMEQLVLPVVHDPALSALEKLRRFFVILNRRKTAQKDFLLALMRVWYTDNNAIVRQKLLIAGPRRLQPLLTEIIHQGMREGVLTTAYPQEVGEVVLSLGETLGKLLISSEAGHVDLSRVERAVAVYTDALERVLGAPTGSLSLTDTQSLRVWFALPENED